MKNPDKSYLTATSRKTMSCPCRWLVNHDLLIGQVLDYGCGRGDDVRLLLEQKNICVDHFDPYYFNYPLIGKYDTIFCIYVLNVIPESDTRRQVIQNIQDLLRDENSKAYIAVRNDRKCLTGYTKRGTFQGYVTLDAGIEKDTLHTLKNAYTMYVITKNQTVNEHLTIITN